MNTKTILTIVAIVAAIGMLGMAAVAVPSVHQAYANEGGVPNINSGINVFKHGCSNEPPGAGEHNGEPCTT